MSVSPRMCYFQLLASQENGESVQGGWDASLNKRALVQLPPLKPELARRSVYFFRTRKQADARLKQFDGKVELLAKKRGEYEYLEKFHRT